MRLAGIVAALSCLAFQGDWASDRALAQSLRSSGIARQLPNVTVWFAANELTDAAMNGFANLVDRGIVDVAGLTGTTIPGRKLNLFVSATTEISHARGNSIYLPLERVRTRTAPYLHEITHAVAPCEDCPLWLSEGFASWAQSYLGEHGKGYDGRIFTSSGNVAVDGDARRWLKRPQGKVMLEFVGSEKDPDDLSDRSGTAAPLYVLAQSFVKFIVEKTGNQNPQTIRKRNDLPALRAAWLARLNS